MSTYVNTSMYQPTSNYSSYSNMGPYGTGFSLSNYLNLNTSIYSGQSMNAGYSAMSSQQQFAPSQNNNNNSSAFLQQLVLMLLSVLLQKPSHGPAHAETVDETEVEVTPKDLDVEVSKVSADAGGKNTLIGLNKKTGEAQILFANATDQGGTAKVDLGIHNRNDFELLLINDGGRQAAVQNAVGKDLVVENGKLYSVDSHGGRTLVSDRLLRSSATSADGVNHANISENGNSVTTGWEDLWGGGDRDYNDLVVQTNFN